MCRGPGPHCFSLIEVLIVVAVVSLLLTIAAPSLTAARERARQVRCASHLRSVGQAIHSFATANGDCPATTIWQRDTCWNTESRIGWDIETGTWADVPGGFGTIWRCPQQNTPFIGNARALGVDRSEAFPGEGIYRVARTRWHEPSRLVLCYDMQYNILDPWWKDALKPETGDISDEYCAWPLSEPWWVQFWQPMWGPHREKFGTLFADGHAVVDLYDKELKAVLWSGPRWWPDHFRSPEPGPGRTDCP